MLQPVAIGKAIHPLRSLLQSEQLSQSVVLPVQREGNSEAWEFGPLKAIYFHWLASFTQEVMFGSNCHRSNVDMFCRFH